MRNSGFLWIIIGLMFLLDIYVFQIIKMISQPLSSRYRLLIFSGYWVLCAAALLLLIALPYLNYENWNKSVRTYLFATVVGLFFAKFLSSIFFLLDDLRRGVTWIASRLFSHSGMEATDLSSGISRSMFLSWLGLAAGGGLFGTLLYGFSNKYKYQVKKLRLSYANLPAAFKGLKIVQVSDIHSGSFTDINAVEKGIEKILSQKPDLILFTGDLVNDRASEMEPYMELFSRLQAPLGVYSILGNHDYGDYAQWETAEAKKENLLRLKTIHASMGWRLLMNEHVVLDKKGDQIALLGIENWSAKSNFPKHGKMPEAYAGADKYDFKILMSHDPSHWDAEIITQYPDIDLMLSGHTHGMQFGLEIPGFKWSPVQYMYRQWAGLYESGRQKLYVNRGFGFIGYPGRVGILPEITVLELV